MVYIFLLIIVLAVVALAISGVVSFFSSGSSKTKKELRIAEQRVSIAQQALIEIASGDAMPVFRASNALADISKTYTLKEIK